MRDTYEDSNGTTSNVIVKNPFAFKLRMPWFRIPQIAVMTVTVVPIRVASMILLHVLAWIITCGTLYGLTDEELSTQPLTGWRRRVRYFVYRMGIVASFVGGFMSVKIKGQQANAEVAPTVVVAPHSSPIDCVATFLMNDCPAVIMKEESISVPIIGKLLKLTQPVLVHRDDKDSKLSVIAELTRRANSNGLWPASIMFPEGTTTNRQALIPFKRGAFVAGKPVQPVTIKYTDMWDTVTWTWLGSPPVWVLWWLTMCKLNNGIIVEFLPVYYPTNEEQNDPQLYAENVRQLMAASLDIPCSPMTIADGRKMSEKARKTE